MNDARIIRDIPIDRIDILNPRARNQKVFREMVASIEALGLKKPITVTARGTEGDERFALVCGQGRIEAFQALGQKTIPAMVIDASDEDAFVMSLVENIARRQPRHGEQLEAIRVLDQRGYDAGTIARKTALDPTWVRGILLLLNKGERFTLSCRSRSQRACFCASSSAAFCRLRSSAKATSRARWRALFIFART